MLRYICNRFCLCRIALCSVLQGLKLVYRFSYLFHRTQFYSPLLWLAGKCVCVCGCYRWSDQLLWFSVGVRLSRNVEVCTRTCYFTIILWEYSTYVLMFSCSVQFVQHPCSCCSCLLGTNICDTLKWSCTLKSPICILSLVSFHVYQQPAWALFKHMPHMWP